MRTTLFLAATLAGSLALGACGGESADDAQSPLAALFGAPGDFAADEIKVQEKVRDCMAALGFPYVPIDPNANGSSVQTIDLNTEDFVKEYGYGISTSVDRPLFEVTSVDQTSDPNQAYLQTLTEADREAYQKALYGELPDPGPVTSEGGSVVVGTAFGGSGCLGEANREVRGDRPVLSQDLLKGMQEIGTKVANDSRVVKAYQQWSSCMAEAGFDYPDEDAVRTSLAERTKAITGRETMASVGGGMVVISGGSIGGPGADATPEAPDYDVAALRALQDEERKTALASLECREKHVERIEQKVRREYEEAFIRDNADLLPQQDG